MVFISACSCKAAYQERSWEKSWHTYCWPNHNFIFPASPGSIPKNLATTPQAYKALPWAVSVLIDFGSGLAQFSFKVIYNVFVRPLSWLFDSEESEVEEDEPETKTNAVELDDPGEVLDFHVSPNEKWRVVIYKKEDQLELRTRDSKGTLSPILLSFTKQHKVLWSDKNDGFVITYSDKPDKVNLAIFKFESDKFERFNLTHKPILRELDEYDRSQVKLLAWEGDVLEIYVNAYSQTKPVINKVFYIETKD